MNLNDLHSPEEKLNNEGDLRYFKHELPNNLKSSLVLMYNAFKDIKGVDVIFLSYLINLEKNPNELNDFINNTKGFTKNRVNEIINELKIILPDIVKNRKIFEDIFNDINNINIKESALYKEYFIGKGNFTKITISIYEFLIEKIKTDKDANLDDIYKFYEKIREIKIKETENRKDIKNIKKEFLKIFGLKRRGLLK